MSYDVEFKPEATIELQALTLMILAEKYLPTFTAGAKAIFSTWGVSL